MELIQSTGCFLKKLLIFRQEFVELHSQPLLEHLRAQLQAQNPGVQLPPLPPRGDLDLSCVLSSPYFFS